MNFYPLKAVVTTNSALASLYDEDPYSTFITSGCVTPDELSKLLEQGANFDALVFVNGEGKELVSTNKDVEGAQRGPRLKTLSIENLDERGAVKRIHALLKVNRGLFDIGG